MGGGKLAASFHVDGLISKYIIAVFPVLLGSGIPFLAVVVRNETGTEEVANELGLDQRALALILRTWLLLVAPHLYTGAPPPANLTRND